MKNAIVSTLLFAFAIAGCASIAPRVVAITPHVVHRPEYGQCIEVGGKVEIDSVGVVTQLSSTCFAAMDAALSTRTDASAEANIEAVVDPSKLERTEK